MSQTRLLAVGIVIATACAAMPHNVEARSCASGPSAVASATRQATAVFVASILKVTSKCEPIINPDGSDSGRCAYGPHVVDLVVEESFKGPLSGRLQLVSNYRFAANERYLIFGHNGPDGLRVDTCSRIRSLSAATEDLKFLNGIKSGAAQGVLYGQVVRLRADGKRYGPTDLFTLVAMAGGNRHEVATVKYGHFDLVLPTGSYLIWIEQDGRQLTNPEALEVRHNDERRKEFDVLDWLVPPP